MKTAIVLLLAVAAMASAYSYYQKRFPQQKAQSTEQYEDGETKPESSNADQPANVDGPLVQWMKKANPLKNLETPAPARKPHPSDRVAPSPVGTSSAIVHKTFAVAATTKFSFEIPPHAASPHLHGTYRSFVQGGVQSSDEDANVDLLLMNNQQYADFLKGRPADTVFSVDSSHDQDVNCQLPATLDHPVQYYLVFRNSASNAEKKVVQADFRVDF
jgi:hypothetical protein